MSEDYSTNNNILCEPLAAYSTSYRQQSLFSDIDVETSTDDIRVIELFAGVGGFRVGLERASEKFKTVWNNQWEPSTNVRMHRPYTAIYLDSQGIAMWTYPQWMSVRFLMRIFLSEDFPVKIIPLPPRLNVQGALKARKAFYGGKYTVSYATIPTLLGC